MALVFAYLGGVCFPKEEDAEENPRAVGLFAQNTSLIVGSPKVQKEKEKFHVKSMVGNGQCKRFRPEHR
jgi:hypothetical protein